MNERHCCKWVNKKCFGVKKIVFLFFVVARVVGWVRTKSLVFVDSSFFLCCLFVDAVVILSSIQIASIQFFLSKLFSIRYILFCFCYRPKFIHFFLAIYSGYGQIQKHFFCASSAMPKQKNI